MKEALWLINLVCMDFLASNKVELNTLSLSWFWFCLLIFFFLGVV